MVRVGVGVFVGVRTSVVTHNIGEGDSVLFETLICPFPRNSAGQCACLLCEGGVATTTHQKVAGFSDFVSPHATTVVQLLPQFVVAIISSSSSSVTGLLRSALHLLKA